MATPVKKREIQQKLTRDKDEDISSSSEYEEEYERADEQVTNIPLICYMPTANLTNEHAVTYFSYNIFVQLS